MTDHISFPGVTYFARDTGSSVMAQGVKVLLGAGATAIDAVGGAGTNSTACIRTTLATDDFQNTIIGATTDSPPGSDTGTASLNGMLKRIAQNITALSLGGGYTEDVAAATDPAGGVVILVRQDTLSSATVSADGDNIAQRGSKYGAAYVTHVDPTGVPIPSGVHSCKTTLVMTSSGVYADKECISNSTSAPTSGGGTFANAAGASGRGGRALRLMLSSTINAETLAGVIFVFDQAATNANDNTAYTPSDADIANLATKIPFDFTVDGQSDGANTTCELPVNAEFQCVGTPDLRFVIQARANGAGNFGSAAGQTLDLNLITRWE